jgi:cell division septal protein FtsQ
VTVEPPRPSDEKLAWFVVTLAFLILLMAILYESVRHPTRDAEIVVTGDNHVTIEPLPEQAA